MPRQPKMPSEPLAVLVAKARAFDKIAGFVAALSRVEAMAPKRVKGGAKKPTPPVD